MLSCYCTYRHAIVERLFARAARVHARTSWPNRTALPLNGETARVRGATDLSLPYARNTYHGRRLFAPRLKTARRRRGKHLMPWREKRRILSNNETARWVEFSGVDYLPVPLWLLHRGGLAGSA